MKALTPAI